jgi:pyruvate,water dikinase
MNIVIPLHRISPEMRDRVGGKSFAMARMAQHDLAVPDGLCVTSEAYDAYVASTGLRERILLELNRKNFKDMRWEEMWDAALRIRNLFLTTPIPSALIAPLRDAVEDRFGGKAVVVRSSAPGEDSAKASFAGLHESYVNVRGTDSILEHIRLVWASLWSDAALLYRQELGLDVERSTMAVVVQEIVVGERSGVAFGKNPNDESQSVIEAVHGLNQGLVDGTVEPDRWFLDRKTGEPLSHVPARREKAVMPSSEGVRLEQLPPDKVAVPPLTDQMVRGVFDLVMAAENLFGSPQDVEWTFRSEALYTIQSRPITTTSSSESSDRRSWYLSLRRSFENLRALRKRIEDELIPAMIEEAAKLAETDTVGLSDAVLAGEIERRSSIHDKWVGVYWSEFIPFAHGARLFGQVYNDTVRPSDPYEFMDLLGASEMFSLERNRMLEAMATMIRENPLIAQTLRSGGRIDDETFNDALHVFMDKYGDQFRVGTRSKGQGDAILGLLLEISSRPEKKRGLQPKDLDALRTEFLSRFEGDQRETAEEVLDLGRASYRLRDDDNVHLGRIEAQLQAAVDEGTRRIGKRLPPGTEDMAPEEIIRALRDPAYVPRMQESGKEADIPERIRVRQLVGQPAGPGVAQGKARVITEPADVFEFKAGEILVCDAVDPNMTFVVPLSAAVVERRGGMLIHGAIIAREYGLPCVTGVPDAAYLIRTGDPITVDGYLGIVTVGGR